MYHTLQHIFRAAKCVPIPSTVILEVKFNKGLRPTDPIVYEILICCHNQREDAIALSKK